jgi:PKD repeat protein
MRSIVTALPFRALTGLFVVMLLAMPAPTAEAQTRQENWCGTQQIFELKYKDDLRFFDPNACPSMGGCDAPATRDAWIPTGDEPIVYIRLYFHVFAESDGTNPAATGRCRQSGRCAEHSLPAVWYSVCLRDAHDHSTQFRWLTASSEFDAMKNAHAISPYHQCNIFVADVNISGEVYSFATFPWDSDALTATGGIVMNDSQFWPSDGGTLSHEMGHCLGLWHTFHGVSEVSQCGACYERPSDPEGDVRGDFCSDTDPTPLNYACSGPGGTDPCSGMPWGATDPQNYMGYAPSNCYTEFSSQQSGRMHCWLRDRVITWTVPLFWSADVSLAPSPVTVNFEAQSPRNVSVWQWDFGSGDISNEQNPTYQYQQPGHYDVTLTIVTPQGAIEESRQRLISAYADTLTVAQIEGEPGDRVAVAVNLRNFLELNEIEIPFNWTGPLNITYDSFSTAGCRTNYFESKVQANYDISNKRATLRLKASSVGASPYLTPGTGPVAKLWFTIPAGASGGVNPISLIEYAVFRPKLTTYAGAYNAARVNGSITYNATCCIPPTVGNVDMSMDNLVTMGDLTVLIDHLFISFAPLACVDEANTDMSPDDLITMGDLTVLIDHLFITFTPLPACP